VTLHLGKRDATPLRAGTPRYSELRSALIKDSKISLPRFPENFGHANAFPGESWLMLGNGPDDSVYPGFGGCGDCAWAGPAHEIMESAKTSGRTVPAFSGKTVVAQYSAYSGYNPQTGENDTGSNLQDVLQWRQTNGIYDDNGTVHKIGRHVALTPGNVQELWEAAWLFERVGLGLQIQEAQQEQFAEGRSWDYVPGSPIDGGHYVPQMGRWGVVSWARRVGVTTRFLVNLNDEAYAWLDNELYNQRTGETAEGFDDQDLEKFLVLTARLAFPA
jgi:hypothetical protein